MRWIFTALFLTLFGGFHAVSQTTYLAHQIDNSNGLSNSCINAVFQDSDNLMWLGTWDGLNVYNGTSMHVFNYGKEAKNYLSSNVIININEDLHHQIWAGTIEGVSKIDKQTGQLTNYFYSKQKVTSNGYAVAVNGKGQVYAARRNGSVIKRYNAKTNQFENCKINLTGMITNLRFDDQGNLWVLKNPNYIEVYRPAANGFQKAAGVPDIKEASGIFYVNHHLLYTTLAGELYEVDQQLHSNKLSALPHEVRAVAWYRQHYIFAWSSMGMGEYTADFKPDPIVVKENPLLSTMRITSVWAGKENILWLGTDGNGMVKVMPKPDYFGAVLKQPNGQPFSIPVRAFCKVGNELWVGTKGSGMMAIKNWGTPQMRFSSTRSFNAGEDLLNNCVYAIEPGRDGHIYIGSDAPGITVYNQHTHQFTDWKNIKNHNRYPAFNSVHCILYDRDSSVWLGLNDNGLVHLKLRDNAQHQPEVVYLKTYVSNNSDGGPANNVIYSLAEGSSNTIWVGCRYGGLSLFDKKTQKFRHFKAFTYPGSLSNNDVLSLYIDRQQRLWVGTSYGLNYLNEQQAIRQKQPVFSKLTVDDGLPNNTIHAVTEDNSNAIWISTNKGIAKINPQSQKIVNFKQADGLQSDEFSDNAVWKSADGEIYFGGIHGFNYFRPENVQVHSSQPQLMLSNLQLAGKKTYSDPIRVLSAEAGTHPEHYDLKPQENYFEQNVEFINFVNPQKCQFSYFLEGNDKAWHQAVHDQPIFYNNLAAGNYTLKIKWTNGEGVWTQPVTAYTLTVRPYFWLTAWAFIAYALAIISSGLVYYRYRKNKFLLKQQLVLEHLLREKDEELHQQQLSFFTNIAHELQTPLTLILGALERYAYKKKQEVDKEKSGHFLSIVKHEAARLHYLVHQLLEFRKAESGQLRNHYSYLDVSGLLGHISGLFSAVTEQKAIDFSTYIEPGIKLWTDKDKLEKIAFNLLSNAFKHTTEKQYVMLSVHALKEQAQLEIVVANSGCQLSATEISRLFELYFAVDDSQQTKISSGIGLAFTRQLVNKLDGEITVKQENGWLSFSVRLPLSLVPAPGERLAEETDKFEQPSYIFSSLTQADEKWIQPAINENNKKSLVKSLEQEEKKKILIVEDEQLIRYLLKDILHEQYVVYEASTGKEALGVIGRSTPDLIISDIMMPDMDGLQLCRVIKDTPASCHIPLILLTARNTIAQETEGYDCGADAYIPKPFHTEHLLTRIKGLLDYQDKLHKYFKAHNSQPIANVTAEMNTSDMNFIERVAQVIEEHIEEDLDSAFLEDKLNISKIQLYRKIKTLSDMTPTELIRQVRLKRAVLLLETTDLTISEIFYRTGFNNKTYFFREFKKIYNCSPNDYRANYRLPNTNKP